jgi:type IV secretion system protein VirB9
MRVVLAVTCCILMGCAATTPPPILTEPQPAEPVVEVIDPPICVEPIVEAPPVRYNDPIATITQANRSALVSPQKHWFRRGMLVLDYTPGVVYRIDTAVDQPTTLIFQPDEMLLKFFGLEGKDRWTVHPIEYDTETGKQSQLLISANKPKMKAGLTVLTTRGTYIFQVWSHTTTGLLAVSWHRPEMPARPVAIAYHTGTLRVGYTITAKGPKPPWMPLRAWDTALTGKTIIAFPREIEMSNAPVIYAVNAAGVAEQLNVRKRGLLYVVDLVAPKMELRVGLDDGAEVVTITRNTSYHQILCPGAAECPPAS